MSEQHSRRGRNPNRANHKHPAQQQQPNPNSNPNNASGESVKPKHNNRNRSRGRGNQDKTLSAAPQHGYGQDPYPYAQVNQQSTSYQQVYQENVVRYPDSTSGFSEYVQYPGNQQGNYGYVHHERNNYSSQNAQNQNVEAQMNYPRNQRQSYNTERVVYSRQYSQTQNVGIQGNYPRNQGQFYNQGYSQQYDQQGRPAQNVVSGVEHFVSTREIQVREPYALEERQNQSSGPFQNSNRSQSGKHSNQKKCLLPKPSSQEQRTTLESDLKKPSVDNRASKINTQKNTSKKSVSNAQKNTGEEYGFVDEDSWVVVTEQQSAEPENKQQFKKNQPHNRRQRGRRSFQPSWKKRKQSTSSEAPLINFSRSEPEASVVDSNSDSDTVSIVGSEFSYKSSVKPAFSSDEETTTFVQKVKFDHNQAKGVIGVFWDIENCSVPKGSSAREIVKKIRQTFYGSRKEDSFVVVCDISLLSQKVRSELGSVYVDLVHVDSGQKNAADAKLKEFLQRFTEVQRPEGSCIVLISGDIDFGIELHKLRYRNGIYVVLIHNRLAKIELIETANEAALFEEFIQDVSSEIKAVKDVPPQYMLLENIPQKNSGRVFLALKSILPQMKGKMETRIKNGCCIIKFDNQTAAKGALEYINPKKSGLFGSPDCNVSLSDEMPDWETIQAALKLSKTNLESCNNQNDMKSKVVKNESPGKAKADVTVVKNELPTKPDVFLILESDHRHGAEFWENFLKNFFKDVDFKDVIVLDNQIHVSFVSHNAAKKMKNRLEKSSQKEIRILGIQDGSHDAKERVDNMKTQKTVASLITSCKQVMLNKRKLLCSEHSKKKAEVEAEISAMQNVMQALPRTTEPSHFNSLSLSLKATEAKKTEMLKQENVFESFLQRNLTRLETFSSQGKSLEEANEFISIMKKELGQECHLFSQALPIYAEKTVVIDMVQKNPVSIILAETGSGKSTQIVQFLYQAGLAESGKIVCTQPRKLAARSLSDYVSNQMGSVLGKLVGYKVGLQVKCSSDTKIMYMTDHCLLNECLKDSTLKDYSCVIVDEVHERSIFTDILLGMLKKILKFRPDFKIVLTSATINPAIFQSYFDVQNDALLNVSGRIFPIEIVWGHKTVSTNYDYVNQSITKAFEIHVSEEPGHILVFLPTPAETMKACDALERLIQQKKTKIKALCLPLHGRLSAEEQHKIFTKPPNNTRKIIFATNCAETSITVPGICYVVDTGMAKELSYDAKTQSNVLKLGMITKSSAEQRKGRAGRTQAGKCYRLFSKENFDTMVEDMKPEIMRVNLGQALLKLMELGIENPCGFEFVESPPFESFLSAMKRLSDLGAVVDDRLTEIGRKMAKLSLEPSLSKLVIRGFEENLGYEAVVTATLASVSGTIFFRLEENKVQADMKKTEFCQIEGDFHTFLEVYKNYAKVSKPKKSQWCVENFINGKAMKITSDGVRDLLQTCEKEFGIPISQTYSTRVDVNEMLQFLILEVFKPNLCIYSGHKSSGYLPLEDSSEAVYLHPSTCLSYLGGIMPQYVVYQTKLFTVKNYITGVTPVSEDAMVRAIDNGFYQKGVIERMKEGVLMPLTLGSFGMKILREFCGHGGCNRRKVEDELSKETKNSYVKVEVDFQTGSLSVFCKKHLHSFVKGIVDQKLAHFVRRMKQEVEILSLDGNAEGIKYVLTAGAVVQEVIMPGEFVKFSVCKIDPSLDITKLLEACQETGEHFVFQDKFLKQGREIFFTFNKVKAAKSVAAKIPTLLNCHVKPFITQQPRNANDDSALFQVFVTWIRRPMKGIGFLKFESEDDFHLYSPKLNFNLSFPFSVQINKKKPTELYLRNIPRKSTMNEIEKIISNKLGSEVKFTLVTPLEDGFETSEENIKAIKSNLEQLFSMYTPRKDVNVDVWRPQRNAAFWKAKISFQNAKDGQITYNAFKNYKTYPGTDYALNMKVDINSTIVCHKDIFTMSKIHIEETLVKFAERKGNDDTLKIDARPNKNIPNFITINIQSNNVGDMERARKVLQEIVQGLKIECLGFPLREKLFSPAGRNELKKFEKETGSKIHFDNAKKTVSVIGSQSSQTQTLVRINQYLGLLDRQTCLVVPLGYPKKPQGLLKQMLKTFGSDLSELKKNCKLFTIELDLPRHSITLCGSNESVQKAEEMINQLSSTLPVSIASEEESCPVCLSPISYNEPQYRLQCCGHVYCQECVDMQIKDKNIPLVCVAEDCGQPFVLADLHALLNPELKSLIAGASLKHLVQMNNKQFRYCPTPECPVVYKIPEVPMDKTGMLCNRCTNEICIRCNVQYHFGYSCEMYQSTKGDEDYSVKHWMKQNQENRKLCPKCNSGIEKNGGCNHMTCWNCHSHICWLCMKLFPDGRSVYSHQPFCSNNQGTQRLLPFL